MVDKKQDVAGDLKKIQYALGENWFVPYGKGTYVKKDSWTDDNKLGDNLFKDLVVTATSPISAALGAGIFAAAGALATGFSLLFAARGLVQTVTFQDAGPGNVANGLAAAGIGAGIMLLALPMAILVALAPIARVLNAISRSLATVAGCCVSADNIVPPTPVIDNPETLEKLATGDKATLDEIIREADALRTQLELPMTTNPSAISAQYKGSLRPPEGGEVELKGPKL